ncbi:MAG: hypothetical protein LBU64_14910 [Planctomycetota bacterium]|nr:hypothetical protein [Planctomycetota bacterium]
MLILAGVDEAGLGPTLGPLVTASAALTAPDGWNYDTPWERLTETVGRIPSRSASTLAVADSKLVYRHGGARLLEATVSAFSLLANQSRRPPISISSEAGESPPHPCYRNCLDSFSLAAGMGETNAAAERLEKELERARARASHLEAAVLFEPSLNRRFEIGLNKHQALLRETGRQLVNLAEKFPRTPMLITVDKQGGRNDYLPFLSGIFPGAWLDALETGANISRYLVRRGEGNMEIRFQAKADRDAFAVALASMTAKYVREEFMTGLNAWFGKLIPGIGPTAGYPRDAIRWLNEARALPCRLDLLVRKR